MRKIAYVRWNNNYAPGKSAIGEAFLGQLRRTYTGTNALYIGRRRSLIDLTTFGQSFTVKPSPNSFEKPLTTGTHNAEHTMVVIPRTIPTGLNDRRPIIESQRRYCPCENYV